MASCFRIALNVWTTVISIHPSSAMNASVVTIVIIVSILTSAKTAKIVISQAIYAHAAPAFCARIYIKRSFIL